MKCGALHVKKHIDTLFRMQKKAIRLITMSAYRANTLPLFKKYKLLTLQEMHIYKVAIFMFKVHHKIAPENFNECFVKNSEIHDYPTRACCNLRVPAFKLEIMKISIRVKGAYIWNFVYNHISPVCSIYSFRISLRKLLLGNENIVKIVP